MSIVMNSAILKKQCFELKLGNNNITSQGIEILADGLLNNKISDQCVIL
jgi:hypothetical protein